MLMKEKKRWMLMTYYCPTHGDSGRTESVEIKRDEINKSFAKNLKNKKKIIDKNSISRLKI